MNRDDARRRVFGALLGGTFGATFGLGLGGFWDWIYLSGVPVLQCPGAFVGLVAGGLAGAAWGLLAAWPRRWWAGALLNGAAVGVVSLLWMFYALAKSPDLLGVDFLIHLATTSLFFVLPDLLLAGLLRGFLELTCLAFWRRRRTAYLDLFGVLLLLVALALVLTWSWDQLGDVGGRRNALRKIHRYGQLQGWEDYTLELERVDSAYAVVRVYLPDGERLACNVLPGEFLTVGDITLWGVTCQPLGQLSPAR